MRVRLNNTAHVNEVNLRRARLVLGWVTVGEGNVTVLHQANSAWPSLRG